MQLCQWFHPMYYTITTLPCHVAHNTAQNGCNDIVAYESTVYMAFVTKVFVKVTLSFLLCACSANVRTFRAH